MRLILSRPITGPDKNDACMGTILGSALLLTHQSCRVSTIHTSASRQQCNLSLQFFVFAFHPFLSLLFYVECLLQLEQVVPLDIDNNNRNNPLFKHSVATSKKPICVETINIYLSSCCLNLSILQSGLVR